MQERHISHFNQTPLYQVFEPMEFVKQPGFVKGSARRTLTFPSIWLLFKSAERNSRWSLLSPDTFRNKRKRALNIHDQICDSGRYPLGCERGGGGRSQLRSELASARVLSDSGPREVSVRGSQTLGGSVLCQRSMLRWPRQVGDCRGPKANQINSTRQTPGVKGSVFRTCAHGSVSVSGPTRRGRRLFMNHSQTAR